MTIYVTCCALKLGIREFEISDKFTMSDAVTFFEKDHVHNTLEEAKLMAEKMRQEKVAKYQKKLERLQAMKF